MFTHSGLASLFTLPSQFKAFNYRVYRSTRVSADLNPKHSPDPRCEFLTFILQRSCKLIG